MICFTHWLIKDSFPGPSRPSSICFYIPLVHKATGGIYKIVVSMSIIIGLFQLSGNFAHVSKHAPPHGNQSILFISRMLLRNIYSWYDTQSYVLFYFTISYSSIQSHKHIVHPRLWTASVHVFILKYMTEIRKKNVGAF